MAEVDAGSPSSLAAQWAQLRELRRYFEQAHSALLKAELLAASTMAVFQTSYLDAAAPGQQCGPQRGGCFRRCADPDLIHAVELLEDALPRALDRPSLGRLRGAARRLRPLAPAAREADYALNSSGSEEKPVGSSGAIPEIASSSSSLPSVTPGSHVELDAAATGGDSSEAVEALICSDSRETLGASPCARTEVATSSTSLPSVAFESHAESEVATASGERCQAWLVLPTEAPHTTDMADELESADKSTGVSREEGSTTVSSSSTLAPPAAGESERSLEADAVGSGEELPEAPPATRDSGESERSLEADAAGSGEPLLEAPPPDAEAAKGGASAEVEGTGEAWLLLPAPPPDESDRAAGPSVEEARPAASSSSPRRPEAPSPTVDCGERERSLEAEVENNREVRPEAPSPAVECGERERLPVEAGDNGEVPPEAPSPALDSGEREQSPEAEVDDNSEVLPEAPSPALDSGEREQSPEAEVDDNSEVLPEAPSPAVDSEEREQSPEAEVDDNSEVLPEVSSPAVDSEEREQSPEAEVDDNSEVLPEACHHFDISSDQGEGDSDALECEENKFQELRRQLSEALERPRLQREDVAEDAAEDAAPRAEGEGGVAEAAVADEDLLPRVDPPEDGEGERPEFEQVWRVVGSRVLVRCDMGLDSSHVTRLGKDGPTDRITTGSLVRELDVRGTRLKYKLLVPVGQPGPLEGWVSISTADKRLMVKESEPPGLRQGWLPRARPGLQMPYAPRIIWTYWDQGVKALPAFHLLCIQSWRKQHPTWRIEVVGQESIRDFVGPEDLPNTFDELTQRQHRADCARSALLCRYGGVYMDPTILAWRDIFKTLPFHDIEEGRRDYVGFFRSSFYMVENWFMACRKGCELIEKWHHEHLAYWKDRRSVERKFNRDFPFFTGVDFSNFAEDELTYLAQHACYLKLMSTNKDFEQMAKTRAMLLDSWVPKYGGLYINKKLKEMAVQKAHTKAIQRGIQNNKLDKGSCIHNSVPLRNNIRRVDVHRRLETQEDIEDSLWTRIYWEDDVQLADRIVELLIPFAKFTSPLSDLLKRLRLRDIRRWPSTLRRLVVLALGEEYQLPLPPGGRPARVKGQLV